MGQQNPEALAYWLDFAGILTWLLKDAGWAMRCPLLTLPAATMSIGIETSAIGQLWHVETQCELVHRVAVFMWLLGNVLWASAEFFFDKGPPSFDHDFGWFHGPIFDANDGLYNEALWLTQIIFAGGLAMLVFYYSWCVAQWATQCLPLPEKPAKTHTWLSYADLISPTARDLLFIGPWLAKDLCWTFSFFWCALPWLSLVVVLLVDRMVVVGGPRPKIMLIWVLANFLWMYSELLVDDAYPWLRLIAGFALSAAAALALAGLLKGNGACTLEAAAILGP
eukprot:CAMPEP_0172877962 /NCGR_PEP_ID=MMETSP1075-20121228/108339_1 /TAXON_ID=2916 /ORGANISM="Ceratium fusus, Strain PA161109" /LENGTH=279 /DNA_ID=CAMNT_0013729639 /DNA_START=79 /DNA_END=915 /DNA_ORIENTATION=+